MLYFGYSTIVVELKRLSKIKVFSSKLSIAINSFQEKLLVKFYFLSFPVQMFWSMQSEYGCSCTGRTSNAVLKPCNI